MTKTIDEARVEREQDKDRMAAMEAVTGELVRSNFDDTGSTEQMLGRIEEIVNKLYPHGLDVHDSLMIASCICYARAENLKMLAESWNTPGMWEDNRSKETVQ
jgi:hypothetical protein